MFTAIALLVSVVFLAHDSVNLPQTAVAALVQMFYGEHPLAFGRFAGALPNDISAPQSSVEQFLLASNNGSIGARRVRGLLAALGGGWDQAHRIFTELALECPNNAAIQNDLGVIEMALAPFDSTAWLQATRQFRLAASLQSSFPEPLFNLILAYHHLGLMQLERAAMANYRRVEPESPWEDFLTENTEGPHTDSLNAQLKSATPPVLHELVARYPEVARTLVLEYAFHPVWPVPEGFLYIADRLAELEGDRTAKVALSALSATEFAQIAKARNLVQAGRTFYFGGRLNESHESYVRARAAVHSSGAVFDQLWIAINDADTLIRLGKYDDAAEDLKQSEELARNNDLLWLRARALSSFGSTPGLSHNFLDAINRLNSAVAIYKAIHERRESARALYYLAGYNYVAGSLEDSLKLALESLAAADPTDYIRVGESHWLISDILYRMGYLEFAVVFNEEASQYAAKVPNPGIIASMRTQLAALYVEGNSPKLAAQQMKEVYEAMNKMPEDDNRAAAQVAANQVTAQIAMATGDLVTAEAVVRRNLEILAMNPGFNATHVLSQSQLLLAKVLSITGRIDEAEKEFRKAIAEVEGDQNYMSKLDFQIAFDRERRELYDSAISFEQSYHGCEQAWNLAQSYKAKLFLDTLGKFNPSLQQKELRPQSVSEVQHRLSSGLQILEYAVLSNNLLAWVVSRDSFECRSINLNRFQLERTILSYLKQLRAGGQVQAPSEHLYELLVEPVQDLLHPDYALVVIPDASLHRLPFAALRSHKDGKYWIEKLTILEAPSVSYLLSEYAVHRPAGKYSAFGSRIYDLFTYRELSALQKIEPSFAVHIGPEVTREKFLTSMRSADILYYAGHSAMDLKEPLRASILLDGDRYGSNSVSALDIIERRMPTNSVVILSSCETSIGNSTDGPALRGLTSAFMIAGAGTVLGSLWPVDSSSTTGLMPVVFNTFLKKGKSIAESLREAQLYTLHSPTFSHPYYWAGFVVSGNLSSLASSEPNASMR